MEMNFDDDLDDDFEGTVDVCPSCGTLLDGIEEPGEGCYDPMGCGAYSDEEYADEDEDDYGVDELDFDN